MLIELTGVNFVNKGAELMLAAILQHFDGGVRLAADYRVGNYQDRARAGLFQKIRPANVRILNAILESQADSKLFTRHGLVTEGQIDAVLDVSGFGYGDQRGCKNTIGLARYTRRWKRGGKKIIMMPQALGPFRLEDNRKAFLEVLANVDLVFARDKMSFGHISDLGGPMDNVHLAPDFTNLVQAQCPQEYVSEMPIVGIVPNFKMVDRRFHSEDQEASYVRFMARAIRGTAQRGAEPVIIVHETGDVSLSEQIRAASKMDVRMISEADPVRIKGILGICTAVVGSRFHSLIGGLCQGVPCVATGWNHKYPEMLADYGCPECLIEDLDDEEILAAKLDLVLSQDSREELVQRITARAEIIKEAAREMWRKVDAVLGV